MAVTLSPLLAAARIPLFAIAPAAWDGPAFIGEVGVRHEGVRVAHLVQFVYLDDLDGTTMGAQVSNLDGRAHREDPVRDHVMRFASRFDPASAAPRGRFRKVLPFGPAEFSRKELTIGIAGETRGAVVLTHRQVPLQLARVAVRRGETVTDLAIVTWRLEVRAVAEKVVPVDARFAAAWDAMSSVHDVPGETEPEEPEEPG